LHVSYNEERAAYEGLPEEWKHINQQFGVPLSQVYIYIYTYVY
jgi:hypothetical protein